MEEIQEGNVRDCPSTPQTCIDKRIRVSEMCLKCQLEQSKHWVKPY